MPKIILPFIIPILLYSGNVTAQWDSLMHKYFNNDSIHYKTGIVSHSIVYKNGDPVMKSFVSVDMPKDFSKYLREKDSTFWLSHLSNEKTDWASKVLLHAVYQVDGTMFAVYKNRKAWLPFKQQDIIAWRSFFKVHSTK
jgi:hypothetical protein